MQVETKQNNFKILVIRRDNIGDLVCTTPSIAALRQRYPDARICALVNSYNVAVVRSNPDLDEVFAYTKGKHRKDNQSVFSVYWDRIKLMRRMLRESFDYAILSNAVSYSPHALRLARAVKPKHIIGFVNSDHRDNEIDIAIPYGDPGPIHEVEDVFRLLEPLGVTGRPPFMRIYPDQQEVEIAKNKLAAQKWSVGTNLIGVHISTRKDTNRWPRKYFIEFIRELYKKHKATFLLLWAPGDSTNPKHPGDDDTAAAIVKALPDMPIVAYPMGPLEQLIADLSLCKTVITSDGGALHIAAALGKPIVCFFGDIDTNRWYPWGVPHVLLQPESRHAADISVDDAFGGYQKLLQMIQDGKSKESACQFGH